METKLINHIILCIGLLFTSVACKVDMQAQVSMKNQIEDDSSISDGYESGNENNPLVADEDEPIEPEEIYDEEGYIADPEILDFLIQEGTEPVLNDLVSLEELQIKIKDLSYDSENCFTEFTDSTDSSGSYYEDLYIFGNSCQINYESNLSDEVLNNGKLVKLYSKLDVLDETLVQSSKLKSAVHQERIELLNPESGSSIYKINYRISSLNLVLKDGSEVFYQSEYTDNGITGEGKISLREQEVLISGITIKGLIESHIVSETSSAVHYYFLNGAPVDASQYRRAFPSSLP